MWHTPSSEAGLCGTVVACHPTSDILPPRRCACTRALPPLTNVHLPPAGRTGEELDRSPLTRFVSARASPRQGDAHACHTHTRSRARTLAWVRCGSKGSRRRCQARNRCGCPKGKSLSEGHRTGLRRPAGRTPRDAGDAATRIPRRGPAPRPLRDQAKLVHRVSTHPGCIAAPSGEVRTPAVPM